MNQLSLSLLSLAPTVLAMLATAPAAPAQFAVAADTAPEAKLVKLQLVKADLAVVLLAAADDRIRLGDFEVLNNAVMMIPVNDGSAPCVSLLDADLGFYWQSLALDGTGWHAGAIHHVAPDRAVDVQATLLADFAVATEAPITGAKNDGSPPDGSPTDKDAGTTLADTNPTPDRTRDDSTPAIDLPMTIRAKTSETGLIHTLHCSFVAPTDGYYLGLVRVDGDKPQGAADVYLYRKLPGKGEGRRDMPEEHSVTVLLAKVKSVRVFLAEDSSSRPGGEVTWRQIARL